MTEITVAKVLNMIAYDTEGKAYRIIGNARVATGARVATDGKHIFGHNFVRGGGYIPKNESEETFIPLLLHNDLKTDSGYYYGAANSAFLSLVAITAETVQAYLAGGKEKPWRNIVEHLPLKIPSSLVWYVTSAYPLNGICWWNTENHTRLLVAENNNDLLKDGVKVYSGESGGKFCVMPPMMNVSGNALFISDTFIDAGGDLRSLSGGGRRKADSYTMRGELIYPGGVGGQSYNPTSDEKFLTLDFAATQSTINVINPGGEYTNGKKNGENDFGMNALVSVIESALNGLKSKYGDKMDSVSGDGKANVTVTASIIKKRGVPTPHTSGTGTLLFWSACRIKNSAVHEHTGDRVFPTLLRADVAADAENGVTSVDCKIETVVWSKDNLHGTAWTQGGTLNAPAPFIFPVSSVKVGENKDVLPNATAIGFEYEDKKLVSLPFPQLGGANGLYLMPGIDEALDKAKEGIWKDEYIERRGGATGNEREDEGVFVIGDNITATVTASDVFLHYKGVQVFQESGAVLKCEMPDEYPLETLMGHNYWGNPCGESKAAVIIDDENPMNAVILVVTRHFAPVLLIRGGDVLFASRDYGRSISVLRENKKVEWAYNNTVQKYAGNMATLKANILRICRNSSAYDKTFDVDGDEND